MALPVGQLNRGQILDLALRKAGNTNTTVRTDAAAWLNQILYDLYTQYTWPFLQTSTVIPVNATFNLPADFLQTTSDTGLVVETVNGETNRWVIHEVDRESFDRRKFPDVTGLPIMWTANRTTGLADVWPTSTDAVIATLRYNFLPPALTTDADVPTFPWHNWLVDATYVRTLEYEFDGRADTERAKLEMALARIRQNAFPLRSQRPDIPLDPQVFGVMFDGD